MKNPTHNFREKNLVLRLTYKSQIKNETNELELAKEKRGYLCTDYVVRSAFFKICVLSTSIVY